MKPRHNHKYRILLGTIEIVGQLVLFADGLRRLGHHVTTAVFLTDPFYPDLKYDVNLAVHPLRSRWPEVISRSRSPLVRLPRGAINRLVPMARLMSLMLNHDIFIFQHAWSLKTDNAEYPFLKLLGKRIVSVFTGSDIRHVSAYDQQFALAEGPDFSLGKVLAEDDDQRSAILKIHGRPLHRPLRNLRMGERYSDVIFSVPNLSGLAVRPYMHIFVSLNVSEYRFNVPGRNIPVIVHAPSYKSVKGTSQILAALDRLRSEGVPFELRLLHGVLHREVRAQLADADVAIDQLYFNLHGKFGVEAMASGCALATCNREDCEPFPPGRPIWHIGATDVYDRLKIILLNKELRIRLAQEGRRYVEQYHDHIRVAQRFIDCLESKIERYDHYPTFFARHYRLPETETVPDNLKRLTAQIVRRWGLPPDVDPQDMILRGLMSTDGFEQHKSIP